MEHKIFKNNSAEIAKYIAKIQPNRDFFHSSRKNLIKNYVLDPDIVIVK